MIFWSYVRILWQKCYNVVTILKISKYSNFDVNDQFMAYFCPEITEIRSKNGKTQHKLENLLKKRKNGGIPGPYAFMTFPLCIYDFFSSGISKSGNRLMHL